MKRSIRTATSRSLRIHRLLGHRSTSRLRQTMEVMVLVSLFALIAMGIVLGHELLALLSW